MMILPIIFIAGAIYMYIRDSHQIIDLSSILKETRLAFARWVSDSHQIADLSSLLKLQPCRVVDNSLNILNESFARGEISEDEYMRIRSTLNNR